MGPFLRWLAKRGRPGYAARKAGITKQRAYEVRGLDPKFRRRWDRATALFRDRYEAALAKWGEEGVTETVRETLPNGDVRVIERHRYDARMALAVAARCWPKEWSKRSTLTVEQGSPQVDAEEQRRLMASPEYREMACRLTELRAALLAEPQALEGPTIDVTPDPPTTREDGGDT